MGTVTMDITAIGIMDIIMVIMAMDIGEVVVIMDTTDTMDAASENVNQQHRNAMMMKQTKNYEDMWVLRPLNKK